MKQLFTCIIFLFYPLLVYSQQHDNIWIFGYSNDTPSELTGGTILDFSEDTVSIYPQNTGMDLQRTNASVCDSAGNLIFYTNGVFIANGEYEMMQNGDGLNPGQYTNDFADTGLPMAQGAMILPKPEDPSKYYLFHTNRHWNPNPGPGAPTSFVLQLYSSLINIESAETPGEVVEKNVLLISDTLSSGRITATRHANGRDWWIIIPERSGQMFYRMLLTPEGINVIEPQVLDFEYISGAGQSVFTPDGSKYISYNLVSYEIGQLLNIFDFDRCTGQLSNHIQYNFADSSILGGIAVSPNSKYAYVSSMLNVYQFDLEAEDIWETMDTVAIYDGFQSPFSTLFYMAQLAPDGKIYINAPNGVDVLHVIHQPNLPGDSCQFEQHGVQLPTYNAFSMPNFPNYRLYHEQGSPCDTLRKPPTAHFEYIQQDDTTFTFMDGSYHDIESWQWQFGDGQTDSIPHPVHAYSSSGTYEVCLKVENPRGVATYCQEVEVLVSGTRSEVQGAGYRLWPNPITEVLNITTKESFSGNILSLYSVDGKVVLSEPLPEGNKTARISMTGLSTGIYFLEVREDSGRIWREKVVVQ